MRVGGFLVFLSLALIVGLGLFGGLGIPEFVIFFVLLAVGVSLLFVAICKRFGRRQGTHT